MASFTFDYRVERAGWAFAVVANDTAQVQMTTSYLHDSLREVAMCAIALLKGAEKAKAVFMDEPGEHHLVFECEVDKTIRYEIRRYDDWASWHINSLDEYDVVIKGRSTLNRISGEILKTLRDVLQKYSVEEYKRLWINHDFPLHELKELEQLKKLKLP